jgi:hypothetical protein
MSESAPAEAGAGAGAAPRVDFGAPPRELVRALLAEDARHRVPGVAGGLYSLRDLEGLPRGRLSPGVPGVAHASAFGTWDFLLAPTDADFAARFAGAIASHPGPCAMNFLGGFDFRRHGIVVAGGFPSAVLLGRPPEGDIDLFLVGHADDEARRSAVVALFRFLLTRAGELDWGNRATFGWRGRRDRLALERALKRDPELGRGLVVHRTRGCVTFETARKARRDSSRKCGFVRGPVQVVLRAYSSVSELLHGFDLGAAQVAFDGERVFLTAMGVFAATRGANVLNLAVRRVSYEARLARYLRRGFTLAAPDLDVGALRAAGTFPPLRDYVVDPDDALRGGPDLVLLRHDHRGQLATARRVEAAALGAGPPAPPADGPGAAERLAALLEELGPDEPRPAGPDGDYAGAAGGDYAGGAIPYGHPAAIVLRNARVLGAARWGAGPPDGAAVGGRGGAARDPASLLCAAAFTSDPAFDLLGFAPEPFPPFREFLEALLLGGQLVERLAALQAAPPDLLRRIWEARRGLAHEALAAAGFGPAAFAPVTDRTALSGDPRYATTPAEWLGPLFAGPAER